MTNLSVAERKDIVNRLEKQLMQQHMPVGVIIKTIRTALYAMTQKQYATFIGISDKTLRDIEKGNTDPRLSVLNKLLRPGGFEVSAKRASPSFD